MSLDKKELTFIEGILEGLYEARYVLTFALIGFLIIVTVFDLALFFLLFLFFLLLSISFFASFYGLLNHWYYLRYLRKIEDIPTTEIKKGAVGSFVEIKGEIVFPQNSYPDIPGNQGFTLRGRAAPPRLYMLSDAPFYFFLKEESGAMALVILYRARADHLKLTYGPLFFVKGENLGVLDPEKSPAAIKFENLVYVLGFAESNLTFLENKKKYGSLIQRLIRDMGRRTDPLKLDAGPDEPFLQYDEFRWIQDLLNKEVASPERKEEIRRILEKTKKVMVSPPAQPLFISSKEEFRTVKGMKWNAVGYLVLSIIGLVGSSFLYVLSYQYYEVSEWETHKHLRDVEKQIRKK